MSPIYRPEEARLSISAEAGQGGYIDYISAVTDAGQAATTLTGIHSPGTRSLVVASTAGYVIGDYVQIGTTANGNAEIRRVTRVVSATVMYVDFPLGFYHANGDVVDEKTIDANIAGNSFATFLPGVYEAVVTPDLAPEILPQYFLGATERNWYVAYRGRESFSGSLTNFILLNGFPLRFPFGYENTIGTDAAGGVSALAAILYRGARVLQITDGTNYANGDFIEIENGPTAETRQIISGANGAGAQTFILNYPIFRTHAAASACREVIAPFTHTIRENSELDSLTWHLTMPDTGPEGIGETIANRFIRRWVGGKVNRATISANEGEILRMSWDEVQFLDMAHNQRFHPSIGGGATELVRYNGAMIQPSGIGGAMPHAAGVLGTPSFPITHPYYFSQGTLSLFGVTFARVRSFRLEVVNEIAPRFYVRDVGSERSPAEMQEQRRTYRISAAIAMPDSIAYNSATVRTLFKELILEGDYTAGFTGFDLSLTFTRGANDTITITSPPAAAATGGNAQGCFFTRAQHSIGAEAPVQVEGEIIARAVRIVAVDNIAVYP